MKGYFFVILALFLTSNTLIHSEVLLIEKEPVINNEIPIVKENATPTSVETPVVDTLNEDKPVEKVDSNEIKKEDVVNSNIEIKKEETNNINTEKVEEKTSTVVSSEVVSEKKDKVEEFTEKPNSFLIWFFIYILFLSSIIYMGILFYKKNQKFDFMNCDLDQEMHYELLKDNDI